MNAKDKKEYADLTYDRVSSWINNCDSKASILLALVGVILSIAFTSDYILGGIGEQVKQVIAFLKCKETICILGSLVLLIILGFSIGFLISSIRKLLLVLYARLDDSSDKDNPSVSYYRSIAAKSFDEYKTLVGEIGDEAFIEDKLHQVYDCSKICTRKFLLYNEGIKHMKRGLVLFAVYMLLFIIKSSL